MYNQNKKQGKQITNINSQNLDSKPIERRLLAIGGGMELSKENPLIQKFIELAGGEDSKITILPTASDFGDEVASLYLECFTKFSRNVEYFIINERSDTEDTTLLNRLKKSTGIFFTGGNQLRITALLGGSEVMNIINTKVKSGMILAGTSAGASALTHTMISWGRSDRMVKGNLQMAPGMGLVEGIVIDSHFIKRGRISRLLHLVAENPGILGVGLAEDTGILIVQSASRFDFEVIGSRQVVLVDGKEISHSNIPRIPENYPFSLSNVHVNILGPGYSYNLETHQITESKEIIEDKRYEPEQISDLPYKPSSKSDY